MLRCDESSAIHVLGSPDDMSTEMTPIDKLPETRVREAVASGEFHRAQQLWNAYMVQLEEEIRQGTFSTTKLAQVRDLMEWSRGVALCARLHAQDRLNRVLIAAKYGSPRVTAQPTIRVSI
jgi:hypothetical protein